MDSDEIRQRRLQRLAMLERAQSQSSGQSSSQTSSPTSSPTPVSSNSQASTPSAAQPSDQLSRRSPISSSTELVSDQASMKTSNATSRRGTSEPPQQSVSGNQREQREQTVKATAKSEAGPVVAPTKQPTPSVSKARADGPTVAFVFGSQNVSSLTWSDIDESSAHDVLWDQISSGAPQPLTYLIGVFNRLDSLERTRPEMVDYLRETVVTLAFLSASAADDEDLHEDLPTALLDASLAGKLDQRFVEGLFSVAVNDDDVFRMMVSGCLELVKKLEFGDSKTSATFRVLEYVLSSPGTAELALTLPEPVATPGTTGNKPPSLTPKQISGTFLGTVMNLGLTPNGLAHLHPVQVLLDSPVQEVIERAKMAEPMSTLLEKSQFNLINRLIRQNETTRRLVLRWFAAVLDANHGQLATNRVPGSTNTLQLMLNSFKVLLKLSEPFVKLGTSFSSAGLLKQLGKINRDYFAYEDSYDVSSETKVLAAENTPFNSRTKTEPSLNFVTECFFLTAGFLQFGFHASVQAVSGSLKQQLEHFASQLDAMPTNPNLLRLPPAMRNVTMNQLRECVKLLKCELAGVTAILHQPEFMGQTLRLAEFTLSYCVYAAQNGPAKALEIRVPWDVTPPENYASYPELLLDGPMAAASFVMRTTEFLRDPSISGGNNDALFDTAIFLMSSPVVLRNPYLRSKFVELLFFGGVDVMLTTGSSIPGPLSALFTTSDTCRRFLLPALMSVFIDIEHTGRTSQFYEKFTTREFVANVLKVLWRDPHYRDQLVTESKEKPEFFVKFVALLLNDATYLLDEALGKLLALNKLESEQETSQSQTSSPQTGGQQAPSATRENAGGHNDDGEDNADQGDGNEEEEEEADPATRIRSAQRTAKNFLDLSKSTVTLLNTFTSTVPAIFATPEIIDRFAVMLNYNLAALVGPRCRELKVRNAAAVGFYPRQLLTDLIRVYLNLRNEPPFPKAIAKDERSYNDTTMRKAQQILTKFNLLSPIDLENFGALTAATREAWHEAQAEEEEFGDDVPDEYLDPLMYTLMENPVILPTSKVNIDLSTIKTHLLSDPTDPFNRVPLKIEDVIPNEELKKEIEEFKRQKKNANLQSTVDNDQMADD